MTFILYCYSQLFPILSLYLYILYWSSVSSFLLHHHHTPKYCYFSIFPTLSHTSLTFLGVIHVSFSLEYIYPYCYILPSGWWAVYHILHLVHFSFLLHSHGISCIPSISHITAHLTLSLVLRMSVLPVFQILPMICLFFMNHYYHFMLSCYPLFKLSPSITLCSKWFSRISNASQGISVLPCNLLCMMSVSCGIDSKWLPLNLWFYWLSYW